MQQPEDLIAQIPLRHDPVSYLMMIGVFLGITLTLIIWLRAPLQNRALHYYAWLMLCLSLIVFDGFLCYTGWMKYTLAWNDSTEPLGLLIAPLLYLCIRFLILRRPLPARVIALHLLPALLYAATQLEYYLAPTAIKFNAYKDAYHDQIPFASVPEGTQYGYHAVKNYFRWLLLMSFALYAVLSLRLWWRHRRSFGQAAGGVKVGRYRFLHWVIGAFLGIFGLLFLVYLTYEDDSGDHFLYLFMFLTALTTTLAFLSESRFFQKAWLIDKYETSSPATADLKLEALERYVEQESFYLRPDPSIKALADAFDTHHNAISRLINQQTGGNYNDFLNAFRIRLAIQRLESGQYGHLTVEAIGREVGFRSKSAFYQAFRKQTGTSPSQFLRRRPGKSG